MSKRPFRATTHGNGLIGLKLPIAMLERMKLLRDVWSQLLPILFETMIFGGEHDDLQRRYETWEEAAAGHQSVVALLRSWYATLRQEAIDLTNPDLEQSSDREF